MSENNNIKSFTKISSVVTERDKKIWENQAFAICIQKETEKLRAALDDIKKRKEEYVKENKILENRLKDVKWSNVVQQQTLITNLESNASNQELINSGVQFQIEMRKKYAQTLADYHQEYTDRRQICMANSHTYQDLHKLEIKEKMFRIKDKDLKSRIKNLRRSMKEREHFRKQIAQNTIIKFARFYIMFHKNRKLKEEIQELKKREAYLIKEHLQKSNLAKEKQRITLRREKHNTNEKVTEKSIPTSTTEKESFDGNLETFLNEDLFPCIMTMSQMEAKVALEPTQETPKIKILEMSTIKPISAKPRLDLRKQAERIAMQVTKKRSFMTDSQNQNSQSSQLSSEVAPLKLSQEDMAILKSSQQREPQTSHTKDQSQLFFHQQKRQVSQQQLSQSQSKKLKSNYQLSQQNDQQNVGVEKITNSILKSQNNADQEPIASKFFNLRKKSVTFQSGDHFTPTIEGFPSFLGSHKKQIKDTVQNISVANNFPMFGFKDAEPENIQNMNIFQKPFAYSGNQKAKPEQNVAETSINRELQERGISDALTAATVSFPTGSTAYVTSNLMSTNSSASNINEQDLQLMDNNFNTSSDAFTYFEEPEEGEGDNFMFGASTGNNFFAFN